MATHRDPQGESRNLESPAEIQVSTGESSGPVRRRGTAVRLAPDLLARLGAEAERRDVSVNWLITRAVERALPAWEEQEFDA